MVVSYLIQCLKHKEKESQQTEAQRLLKKGKRTQRENARLNRLQPTAETMKEMTLKMRVIRRADGKPTKPQVGEIDLVVKQVLKTKSKTNCYYVARVD